MSQKPILIVGLPRSGTTWVSQVLTSVEEWCYIHEPDNEKISPIAWIAKKDLHRFPYLTPQDSNSVFETMWNVILSDKLRKSNTYKLIRKHLKSKQASLEAYIGERTGFVYINDEFRTVKTNATPLIPDNHKFYVYLIRLLLHNIDTSQIAQNIIIKSVHAPLCIEWIYNLFPINVIVILRNPYSLFASYKRMKMPDGYRNLLFQDSIRRDIYNILGNTRWEVQEFSEHIIIQMLVMYKIMERQLKNNPAWIVVSHDQLCINPDEGFSTILKHLGIKWSEKVEKSIFELNKHGSGFTPMRISKIQPTKWLDELDIPEKKLIGRWIDYFEMKDFINTLSL